MKFSIFNLSGGIVCLLLMTLLSCGTEVSNESVAVRAPPPPPPPPTMNVKDTSIKGKLLFEPSVEDQKKYKTLKSMLEKNKTILLTAFKTGSLSTYKNKMGLNPQKIMNAAEIITSHDLKKYLTQQSLDKSSYDSEMNKIGTVLGFSLIDNFGNSKDQGKYLEMSSQVKQLINSGVVTTIKELRAKMFQAELNSKMTPTPGNENLKIEIGDDGKVYIKQ